MAVTYCIIGCLIQTQVEQAFRNVIIEAEALTRLTFAKGFEVLIVRKFNPETKTQVPTRFGYVWIEDLRVANLLCGKNPDGSDRMVSHPNPDYIPREYQEPNSVTSSRSVTPTPRSRTPDLRNSPFNSSTNLQEIIGLPINRVGSSSSLSFSASPVSWDSDSEDETLLTPEALKSYRARKQAEATRRIEALSSRSIEHRKAFEQDEERRSKIWAPAPAITWASLTDLILTPDQIESKRHNLIQQADSFTLAHAQKDPDGQYHVNNTASISVAMGLMKEVEENRLGYVLSCRLFTKEFDRERTSMVGLKEYVLSLFSPFASDRTTIQYRMDPRPNGEFDVLTVPYPLLSGWAEAELALINNRPVGFYVIFDPNTNDCQLANYMRSHHSFVYQGVEFNLRCQFGNLTEHMVKNIRDFPVSPYQAREPDRKKPIKPRLHTSGGRTRRANVVTSANTANSTSPRWITIEGSPADAAAAPSSMVVTDKARKSNIYDHLDDE